MKRTTTLGKESRVETFDLSQEQHDMVVEMVKNGKHKNGNYTLKELDADTLDIWIDNAESEGEDDYAAFLSEAQWCDADTYTLTDHLGGFSQPIGDVAVYNN